MSWLSCWRAICANPVDDRLVTSDPDILAAGDVAEHRGVMYGIWAPSQYQGSIAGMNAVGLGAEFGGIPRSNTLKVLGVDLFSIGVVEPEDASSEVLREEAGDSYFRFIFRDTRLLGAILLGDTGFSAYVKRAVEEEEDFSGLLARRPSGADVVDHMRGAAGA